VTAGREPGALAWGNGRMLVSFPDGGLTGTSPVPAAVPREGGYGVIVAQTPFHPLDHTWPDLMRVAISIREGRLIAGAEGRRTTVALCVGRSEP
jgi:hypothetical protein